MKSFLSPALWTAVLLCVTLAAPPPADAGPLTSIRAGLKKLNPFRKAEPKPAAEPEPPPLARTKPAVAKPAKPALATRKKSVTTSPKKNSREAPAKREIKPAAEKPENPEGPATAPEPPGAADAPPPVAESPPQTAAKIPFATPVMGRKGYVLSPFAEDQGMVDVTDIPAGSKVKCPFTGKVFRVP